MWDSADDFEWQDRKYTETDIPVDAPIDFETEQAQKAAAFDYLTGRSDANE
jgi:hypothetical protein